MSQNASKISDTETEDNIELAIDDTLVFEEVNLFSTALIQGACTDSPSFE